MLQHPFPDARPYPFRKAGRQLLFYQRQRRRDMLHKLEHHGKRVGYAALSRQRLPMPHPDVGEPIVRVLRAERHRQLCLLRSYLVCAITHDRPC